MAALRPGGAKKKLLPLVPSLVAYLKDWYYKKIRQTVS